MSYPKPSHILYQALGGPPPGEAPRCQICGGKGYPILGPVKKFVSGNWTDWALLQDGYGVCEACATVLKDARFRTKSYAANPREIRFMSRGEVWHHLHDPPEPPFIFVVTTSHKKHLWYRAIVNYSRDEFGVVFEDAYVIWSPEKREAGVIVAQLRHVGVPGDAILSGQLPSKAPLEAWELLKELKAFNLNRDALEFLVHIVTKEVARGIVEGAPS